MKVFKSPEHAGRFFGTLFGILTIVGVVIATCTIAEFGYILQIILCALLVMWGIGVLYSDTKPPK